MLLLVISLWRLVGTRSALAGKSVMLVMVGRLLLPKVVVCRGCVCGMMIMNLYVMCIQVTMLG